MKELISLRTAAVDADDNTEVTASIDLAEGQRNLFMAVVAVSGANTTHVVEVQVSPNNTNWAAPATAIEVTGLGNKQGTVDARFVRLKVKTEEGGASIVDLYLDVKV